MRKRKFIWLTVLPIAVLAFENCGTSKGTVFSFSNDVDSIKVEISTKLSTNQLILNKEKKAILRLMNQEEASLSEKETARLKKLAQDLFIEKNTDIVLSETEARGRTSHPVFTVTLYSNGKDECKRYDMGDEKNGITQCTKKNIKYSDSFRDFMFTVLHILN